MPVYVDKRPKPVKPAAAEVAVAPEPELTAEERVKRDAANNEAAGTLAALGCLPAAFVGGLLAFNLIGFWWTVPGLIVGGLVGASIGASLVKKPPMKTARPVDAAKQRRVVWVLVAVPVVCLASMGLSSRRYGGFFDHPDRERTTPPLPTTSVSLPSLVINDQAGFTKQLGSPISAHPDQAEWRVPGATVGCIFRNGWASTVTVELSPSAATPEAAVAAVGVSASDAALDTTVRDTGGQVISRVWRWEVGGRTRRLVAQRANNGGFDFVSVQLWDLPPRAAAADPSPDFAATGDRPTDIEAKRVLDEWNANNKAETKPQQEWHPGSSLERGR